MNANYNVTRAFLLGARLIRAQPSHLWGFGVGRDKSNIASPFTLGCGKSAQPLHLRSLGLQWTKCNLARPILTLRYMILCRVLIS